MAKGLWSIYTFPRPNKYCNPIYKEPGDSPSEERNEMIFRYAVPSMLYSLEYPTNIISAPHLDRCDNKISANPCLEDKNSILHLSPQLFHLIPIWSQSGAKTIITMIRDGEEVKKRMGMKVFFAMVTWPCWHSIRLINERLF